MYNTGSYVLGVLIARATGQPLETFFRERIFDPLGMKDTSLSVPSSKLDRLSTADDLLLFGQMLLNKGELGGTRILSRPTVETMTTDQLTAEQKARSNDLVPGYFEDHGWGFGVSVVTRRTDPASPVGKFCWDGGLGTSW